MFVCSNFYTSSYVQELAVLADSRVHLLFRREDLKFFSWFLYHKDIYENPNEAADKNTWLTLSLMTY